MPFSNGLTTQFLITAEKTHTSNPNSMSRIPLCDGDDEVRHLMIVEILVSTEETPTLNPDLTSLFRGCCCNMYVMDYKTSP